MPYQRQEFYETQGRLFLEGKLALEPSNNEIRSMVLKMFNNLKGKRVLDIGIGPKPLVDIELLKKGYSLVGIDISYSFIMSAKRYFEQDNLEAELIVSEAVDLPFGAGTFDLCLCSELIEHVKEPQVLLKEIRRVLKAGGKLILTTPNKFSLDTFVVGLRQMLQQKKSLPHPSHAKEYSYYEISRICQKFFDLRAYYHTKVFPTQGLPFFRAPAGKVCNFIVGLPFLNRLAAGTMGFIFDA